jgi:hypothetical protein
VLAIFLIEHQWKMGKLIEQTIKRFCKSSYSTVDVAGSDSLQKEKNMEQDRPRRAVAACSESVTLPLREVRSTRDEQQRIDKDRDFWSDASYRGTVQECPEITGRIGEDLLKRLAINLRSLSEIAPTFRPPPAAPTDKCPCAHPNFGKRTA